MTRAPRRVAQLALITLALAALGTPAVAAVAHDTGGRPDLPPPTKEALAALFDAKLAPLGLHTTRATLQSLETYRSDPNGRHLAIYVEPTDASSDARYITNIVKSARIFLPSVFRTYRDLKSFDVCQEPLPGVDDSAEPPPMTQLLVSRKGAAYVNWNRATLTDLVRESTTPRATAAEQRSFYLYVNDQLAKQPAYKTALSKVPTTSTSSANG